MYLEGLVRKVTPVQSGTSQKGNQWSKQGFVLRYEEGQYPKEAYIEVFNDEKYVGNMKEGIYIGVNYDLGVHEWKDSKGQVHYQTQIIVWRDGIHSIKNGQQTQATAQPQTQAKTAPQPQGAGDGSEELPF